MISLGREKKIYLGPDQFQQFLEFWESLDVRSIFSVGTWFSIRIAERALTLKLILPAIKVQLVNYDSAWQLDWIEARAILRLISLWNSTPPA